jgi:thiol-disulfide isomerase/thioredoxin
VDELIDAGNSLSGREPNCAFLNAGNGTFATVSALSGFDFPDDARSMALTDWDGDGDLDVWMTNRTAPMLRFLRNDAPSGRTLQVRLEGTAACRDAAGAKVEVRLRSAPERPVVRTVKLGEGFLGQSSRVLHFGLGKEPEIASVGVRWPDGSRDELRGVQPGSLVRFTQGDPFPVASPVRPAVAPGPPRPLEGRSAALSGAVALFHPVPFPALPSERPDGTAWSVSDAEGPVLLNLFASWCPDCRSELTEWKESAEEFRRAGVHPVLLCADGRDERHDSTTSDAWAWLRQQAIPFPAGRLTDEAFRRLNAAHRQLFGAIVSLPIPTSFLLDGRGRLVAVYRGRTGADRILRDAAAARDGTERYDAALPFPGRWLVEPAPPDPSFWLNDLAAGGHLEEAAGFFRRHAGLLERHRDFPAMAGALGGKLAESGKVAAAIACLEAGLARVPEDPGLLNNLAGLLASGPEAALRRPAEALAMAERANRLSGGKSPFVLDTLAAAQAANGDFRGAAGTAARALAAAESAGEKALAAALRKSLAAFRNGRMP